MSVVGDTSDMASFVPDESTTCAFHHSAALSGPMSIPCVEGPVAGQHVVVYKTDPTPLSLCEVEVYAGEVLVFAGYQILCLHVFDQLR